MIRIAAAAAGLLLLAGCTASNITSTAVSTSRAALSPERLALVEGICRRAAPALVIAAGDRMPDSVRKIAAYPAAYCDELLNGTVPETTDANTSIWLERVLRLLGIAARVARIALPGL